MDGAAKTKQTTSKNFVAGGARVRSGADAPRADGSESFALLLLLPRAAQLGKVAILDFQRARVGVCAHAARAPHPPKCVRVCVCACVFVCLSVGVRACARACARARACVHPRARARFKSGARVHAPGRMALDMECARHGAQFSSSGGPHANSRLHFARTN